MHATVSPPSRTGGLPIVIYDASFHICWLQPQISQPVNVTLISASAVVINEVGHGVGPQNRASHSSAMNLTTPASQQ